MQKGLVRFARGMALVSVVVLAACGGGGGGGEPAPQAAAPAPDARNGSYTMVAANAHEYSLALDFNAGSYRVSGNGVDQAGSFSGSGDTFQFQPGNSTGSTGTSTTRFTVATDAIVGQLALPDGAVPFVAARTLATTIADAAGTYNLLGRTVGDVLNTTIQQGEITSAGLYRMCNDQTILEISACPASSVETGTVTVSGTTFTAATSSGNVVFHVARIGADKVFLRGSASAAGTRRFMIGTPARSSFTAGTFVGGTTEPAWGSVTVNSPTFSATGTSPAGVTTTRTGTSRTVASADTRASLIAVSTTDAGNFFAIGSSEIGAVIAARNNALAPGFLALGKRQ